MLLVDTGPLVASSNLIEAVAVGGLVQTGVLTTDLVRVAELTR